MQIMHLSPSGLVSAYAATVYETDLNAQRRANKWEISPSQWHSAYISHPTWTDHLSHGAISKFYLSSI